MRLSAIDWAIIGFFFFVYLVIGILVSRQAGKSFQSFFLGGQKMPWWILGLSMVATTFATDTPNLVANIVRQNGVSGNWIWWAFLLSGVVTVFFFARLRRRSGVMTDTNSTNCAIQDRRRPCCEAFGQSISESFSTRSSWRTSHWRQSRSGP